MLKSICDIKKDILLNILNNYDLFKIRDNLIKLKELDYSSTEAYDLVNSLRVYFKDCPEEDMILEILDICSGFCSIDMEVWNN